MGRSPDSPAGRGSPFNNPHEASEAATAIASEAGLTEQDYIVQEDPYFATFVASEPGYADAHHDLVAKAYQPAQKNELRMNARLSPGPGDEIADLLDFEAAVAASEESKRMVAAGYGPNGKHWNGQVGIKTESKWGANKAHEQHQQMHEHAEFRTVLMSSRDDAAAPLSDAEVLAVFERVDTNNNGECCMYAGWFSPRQAPSANALTCLFIHQ
jgi:hypothetical protein